MKPFMFDRKVIENIGSQYEVNKKAILAAFEGKEQATAAELKAAGISFDNFLFFLDAAPYYGMSAKENRIRLFEADCLDHVEHIWPNRDMSNIAIAISSFLRAKGGCMPLDLFEVMDSLRYDLLKVIKAYTFPLSNSAAAVALMVRAIGHKTYRVVEQAAQGAAWYGSRDEFFHEPSYEKERDWQFNRLVELFSSEEDDD